MYQGKDAWVLQHHSRGKSGESRRAAPVFFPPNSVCINHPKECTKLWLKGFFTAHYCQHQTYGILVKDEDSHTPADHSYVEVSSNIFSAVTNVDLASILTDG